MVFTLNQFLQISESAELSVTVYYECLCPDSKDFIANQLYPTWERLGKYFLVEFKPFGKATVYSNNIHISSKCK